jgi:cytochrome c553
MKTWLISVSVTALLLAGGARASTGDAAAAVAAGDAAAGEGKVAVCLACHGPNGNSLVPTWPKLAGQHHEYIYKQLMDFKSGARVNDQMSPQVLTLNEQDFRDIAAYYASQQQTPGAADPALVELGEQIYRGGNPATGVASCGGCHGPAGLGLGAAKFPRISGQHAQYAESTLKHFRIAERANDPNGMMRGVASRMTDEEIAAVAQYVQGLTQ